MKWFDSFKVQRIFGRAKHKSREIELHLVAGITTYGLQRRLIQENIIRPLKEALAKRGSSFGWSTYHLTKQEQSLLEREAALAALACGEQIDKTVSVEGITLIPSIVTSLMSDLLQAEILAEKDESRPGRSIQVEYSSTSQEALGQLIVAWATALKIDHPEFKTTLIGSDLPKNWNEFRALLGGVLLAYGRNPLKPAYDKAISIIVDMPHTQRCKSIEVINRFIETGMPNKKPTLAPKGKTQDKFILLVDLAAKGLPEAQCDLGYHYAYRQSPADYPEAIKWFLKAANQGCVRAQTFCAICYERGNGVPQNHLEAFEWYQKAGTRGDCGAQYHLGLYYSQGLGVIQDYTEAAKWFLKAADQGHCSALFRLGQSYENGHGVQQNPDEAMRYYFKALEHGNIEAIGALKNIGVNPKLIADAINNMNK